MEDGKCPVGDWVLGHHASSIPYIKTKQMNLLIMPINIFVDFRSREGAFILFLIDHPRHKKTRALFAIEYYQKYGLRFDIFWLGIATEFKNKNK